MTRRCAALLRAINVGGHIVKMQRLREALAPLPLQNVATFIASGNVLFDSDAAADALEEMIETRLLKELGYEVTTFVRTVAELRKVAARKPFADAPGTLYVGFLKKALAAAAKRALLAKQTDADQFDVIGREVYWLIRSSFSDSTFSGNKLEKIVGPTTIRNINSVRRMAAMGE